MGSSHPRQHPPAQEQPSLERPWRSLGTTLRRRPLLVCTLLFLLGILIADAGRLGYALPGFVCIAAVGIALLTTRRAPSLSSAGVAAAFLFLGMFLHSAHIALPPDDISRLAGEENCTITGTVASAPEVRWERQVFRLRVKAVMAKDAASAREVSGLAVTRAPGEPQVDLGDVIQLAEATVGLPKTSSRPGTFDYRRWLRRQGVTAEVRSKGVTVTGRETGGSLRLARLGAHLREAVAQGIQHGMGESESESKLYTQLLMGMVYGLEATPLPGWVVNEFRRAGTVHLLVVSGAQVTMLVAALLWLTGAGLHTVRWWHMLITGVAVLVLVLIVGLGASVARAVAMFVLLIVAGLTSRDYDFPTALAFAVLVICLFDTNALFSASLQLTFAATIGVAAFLAYRPPRPAGTPPLPRSLRVLGSVAWGTAGAWVMVTPLLAYYFSNFALVGNVANLVNVPLSGVTMVLGFLALPIVLLATVSWLAWLKVALLALCWLARLALEVVMGVNSLAGSLPLAYIPDFHLTALECVLWYGFVAVALLSGLLGYAQGWIDARLRRTHPAWAPIGVLCLIAAVALAHGLAATGGSQLEVTFLPVGAGQCAVIRAPSGATMMIDCGGRGSLPGSGHQIADGIVRPYLREQGITRLDVVVITHWDADHYNALPELLKSAAEVGTVLLPPEFPDAEPSEELGEALAERRAPARAGATVRLGKEVSARLLAPRRPFLRWTQDDANNNSVTVRLTYGQVSFLFTGDLEGEGVRRLVRDFPAAGGGLRAQVLQLPHHGRPLKGIGRLLEAVRPTWAVASCGGEAHYYLKGGVGKALQQRHIPLLRTDLRGAVTFTTDGRALRVHTSRGRARQAETPQNGNVRQD